MLLRDRLADFRVNLPTRRKYVEPKTPQISSYGLLYGCRSKSQQVVRVQSKQRQQVRLPRLPLIKQSQQEQQINMKLKLIREQAGLNLFRVEPQLKRKRLIPTYLSTEL